MRTVALQCECGHEKQQIWCRGEEAIFGAQALTTKYGGFVMKYMGETYRFASCCHGPKISWKWGSNESAEISSSYIWRMGKLYTYMEESLERSQKNKRQDRLKNWVRSLTYTADSSKLIYKEWKAQAYKVLKCKTGPIHWLTTCLFRQKFDL